MTGEQQTSDPQMNAEDLYREEVFTDRKVGTIRRLTPVTPDGEPDAGRSVLYLGQAQMMSSMGAVPLSFEIPASSLSEAAAQFAGEANKAVERTMKEIQEMQREAASSIVVPQGGGGGGGMPGGGGGMPGGGNIQMP